MMKESFVKYCIIAQKKTHRKGGLSVFSPNLGSDMNFIKQCQHLERPIIRLFNAEDDSGAQEQTTNHSRDISQMYE